MEAEETKGRIGSTTKAIKSYTRSTYRLVHSELSRFTSTPAGTQRIPFEKALGYQRSLVKGRDTEVATFQSLFFYGPCCPFTLLWNHFSFDPQEAATVS